MSILMYLFPLVFCYNNQYYYSNVTHFMMGRCDVISYLNTDFRREIITSDLSRSLSSV